MTISERSVGSVTLVTVEGRIAVQDGAEEFGAFLQRVIRRGVPRVILNLAHVPYIDSTALGELVRGYTTATRAGGTLKLLHVSGPVQGLLVTTGLAAVFDSFDAEDDAIRSFGRVAAVTPNADMPEMS